MSDDNYSNYLSDRELEILKLVLLGKANKQIAHELSLSPETIKTHMKSIFSKMKVSGRTQAAVKAYLDGITTGRRRL